VTSFILIRLPIDIEFILIVLKQNHEIWQLAGAVFERQTDLS